MCPLFFRLSFGFASLPLCARRVERAEGDELWPPIWTLRTREDGLEKHSGAVRLRLELRTGEKMTTMMASRVCYVLSADTYLRMLRTPPD